MHIIYPFSSEVNPKAEILDEIILDWASTISLLANEAQYQLVKEMKINWFAAYLYPGISLPKLVPIAKLFLMLFILDDIWDNRQTNLELESRFIALKEDLILILQGRKPNFETQFTKAFTDFLGEWRHMSGDTQIRIFIEVFKDYLSAQSWEYDLKLKNICPSMAEYCQMRPIASGALIATYFAATLNPIPESFSNLFKCQLNLLELRTAELICISNDITSYKKEWSEGSNQNYLIILMHTYNLSFDKAYNIAIKKHNKLLLDFLKISIELSESNNFHCIAYINNLKNLISGSFKWSETETSRYENIINGSIK
ncbi:terpene synthase family protein [Belliella pelovolcani]|uniref:Terpene synthase n=1 Tax=Belliella pelovolcani TaxID=529505 RepID=A0A1N7KE47_9BACT|nr:hypothetical protein [Belliella pelovolcani]SIS59760.1 Terpene synthase family, metal binding domain [Belliella pelovolcani]